MDKVIGIIITLVICAGLIICGSFLMKKNRQNSDGAVSAAPETSEAESVITTAAFTQIEFDEYDDSGHTAPSQFTETSPSEDQGEDTERKTASAAKENSREEQLTNIWDLFNQGLEEEYME